MQGNIPHIDPMGIKSYRRMEKHYHCITIAILSIHNRPHTYIHTSCMHACIHTYITLHYTTLPYNTLHYMTWHDMTWLDNHMTLHDMPLHDMTWHDMTWHDITWHYITLHPYIHPSQKTPKHLFHWTPFQQQLPKGYDFGTKVDSGLSYWRSCLRRWSPSGRVWSW